jgi:hypothetical protein
MKYDIAGARVAVEATVLIFSICALSPAIEPRKSPQDYPSHGESAAMEIGIDYQVHSYSADGEMYFTRDYLVCEVAVYPKVPIELTGSSFELRINRSKSLIPQASPEFVAASLKYPDWTQRSQLELGAGVGDSGVTLGAPPAVGRFPGDPSAGRTQPRPPRAPEDPNKVEKSVKDASQLALDTALRPGRITTPVSGNVYFEYSANLKKLKNLSLIVHTSAGSVEVPIR